MLAESPACDKRPSGERPMGLDRAGCQEARPADRVRSGTPGQGVDSRHRGMPGRATAAGRPRWRGHCTLPAIRRAALAPARAGRTIPPVRRKIAARLRTAGCRARRPGGGRESSESSQPPGRGRRGDPSSGRRGQARYRSMVMPSARTPGSSASFARDRRSRGMPNSASSMAAIRSESDSRSVSSWWSSSSRMRATTRL